MIVIPAIDLRGGRVVRLTHGNPAAETVYNDDPVAVAKHFAELGAHLIHVVDLDAALGDGDNKGVIASICRAADVPVETGGGLRSIDDIRAVLDAGALRAVVGTSAVQDPEMLREAVETFGSSLIVALDVKGRDVAVRGWTDALGPIDGYLPALSDRGVARFMITQIEVDGTMQGADIQLYEECVGLSDKPIIASGGVSSNEDLPALRETGVEAVIVGKAIYEGNFDLQAALQA